MLAAILLAAWIAPVAGHVTRPFDLGADPFEAGRHRGADFAARPGAPVRAACSGRVVVAGQVGASGRVVTIRCGAWRVTALPLASLAVRPGETVLKGDRIGTAARAPDHAGVHLGVRREGDRFGYVDPLRFLGAPVTRTPPVGPAAPRRPTTTPLTGPVGPAGRPVSVEPRPRPVSVEPRGRTVSGEPIGRPRGEPAGSSPVAPWPVWAGLGLALAGALGAVAFRVPRSRRAPVPRASPERVR